MIPSMSRPVNPYDNASCESFMKTLKREEIYAPDYQDLSTEGFTPDFCGQIVSRIISTQRVRNRKEWERMGNARKFWVAATILKGKDLSSCRVGDS
jgi:transposase InsO family protein